LHGGFCLSGTASRWPSLPLAKTPTAPPKSYLLHAVGKTPLADMVCQHGGMSKRIAVAPPATPAAADLLTDEQAAALLSVEPRTLRLWRHTRGLPHIRITSKVIRYRRADLDAWLSRHFVTIRSFPA
jgi:excisionase family DNA binding protein